MKFEDLKVGMRVRATGSKYDYAITNKKYKWIGIIVDINNKAKTFSAKTDKSSCDDGIPKDYIFKQLELDKFEPTKKEANLPKRGEREILRVTEHNQKIKVWYKDKVIAEARCSEEDNYDEEFGLNLALRRFCKTLKDEHKVVITQTERVDDYL